MKKHLFHAAMIAATAMTATMTAPMAQAAVTPAYAMHLGATDVLVNRPNPAAEIQLVGLRPPSVASLIRWNMRIWGCVGWQYGRLEAIKKYGIDIGARCPR